MAGHHCIHISHFGKLLSNQGTRPLRTIPPLPQPTQLMSNKFNLAQLFTSKTRQQLISELLSAFAAAIICILATLWLNQITPGFFYYDDVQHYFFPILHDILPALKSWHVPHLTLRTWTAGWLDAEWGLGLHNPITLISYVVTLSLSDPAIAATGFVAIQLSIMATGVFLLARHYQLIRPAAILVSVAFCLSPFNLYWLASGWWNGLTALAWFPWAWLFLERSERGKRDFLLGILFSYFLIASGWVHAIISITLMLLTRSLLSGQAIRSTLNAWSAWVLACLLSLPIVLPFIRYREMFFRASGIAQNFTLTLDMNSLTQIASPFYEPYMRGFDGVDTAIGTPVVYAGWFIIPVFIMGITHVRRHQRPLLLVLGACTAIFGLLTLGPSQFGPTRWPFRFLSFLHLPLLILAGAALTYLSREKQETPRFFKQVLFGWCLVSFIGWQVSPADWKIIISSILGLSLLTWLTLFRSRGTKSIWGVLVTTILLFVLQHAYFIRNPQFGEYKALDSTEEEKLSRAQAIQVINTLILAETKAPGLSGNLPLISGRSIINGYSPTPNASLKKQLCLNWDGTACPEAADALFKTDPISGNFLIDLMGVNEVLAQNGKYAENFRAHMSPNWNERIKGEKYTQFVRLNPPAHNTAQSTISWYDPKVLTASTRIFRVEHEEIVVDSRLARSECSLVIFRRPYYPGYTVTLNENILPTIRHQESLLATQLCGPVTGILKISFGQ